MTAILKNINSEKSTIISLLILFALSFLIIFAFGFNSSIFYSDYSGDYSVFKLVGKSWLEGTIPYRDLFDHKGPVMYLIQMAGLCISGGKLGIFLIEVIFCFASFTIIYFIGRALKTSLLVNWITLLFSAFYFIVCATGGNLTEEYCLPFQLLALYLFIKHFSGNSLRTSRLMYLLGLCFGIVAMIRINNNIVICGLIAGYIVNKIYCKQYRELIRSIIIFSLGVLTIIVPFVIYFWLIGALGDFIYCNFGFNLAYKANWNGGFGLSNTLENLKYLYPCLLLPIYAILSHKRVIPILYISYIFIGLITFFTFFTGANYGHYFIMTIPSIVLSIIIVSNYQKKIRVILIVMVIIPFFIIQFNTFANALRSVKANISSELQTPFVSITETISKIIPQEDLDSVYIKETFLITPILELDKIPVGKFTFLQDKISKVDKQVEEDIINSFEKANPRWILSTDPIETSEVIDGSNYVLKYEQSGGLVYFIYQRNDLITENK